MISTSFPFCFFGALPVGVLLSSSRRFVTWGIGELLAFGAAMMLLGLGAVVLVGLGAVGAVSVVSGAVLPESICLAGEGEGVA